MLPAAHLEAVVVVLGNETLLDHGAAEVLDHLRDLLVTTRSIRRGRHT